MESKEKVKILGIKTYIFSPNWNTNKPIKNIIL